MKTIAFLCQNPIQELDLFGPLDIFSTANYYRENYKIILLSADKSKLIKGRSGVTINADYFYKRYSGKIDTLIVLGTPESVISSEILEWVKSSYNKVKRLCSVCTGAFTLAEAGLLNNKKATTHWMWEKEFQKRFPEVHLDISSIWTKDGKIYTSAGVSTGIDLALALVEEDFGSKSALKIAKGLVLFLRRSGNQKQFSETLKSQSNETTSFKDLSVWLQENLRKKVSVEMMAGKVGMSPRNFSRQFKITFNQGPGEYLRKLRVRKAQELLESSEHDWKKISSLCGMDGEILRRAFIREVGISPQDYVKRFKLVDGDTDGAPD